MSQETQEEPVSLSIANSEDCLHGGGEMGALLRTTDWSRTPVGPVRSWPQSLRTAVSMMLETRFGMYIAWGREYTQFYNDAYRPILGSTKHPALGKSTRETFAESYHIIGPLFDSVMAGNAVGSDDWMLPLDRHGYLEECYFIFSYSPIRDESGGVGGVLVTVTESTQRVLGERRLRTLRDLAARASETADVKEAWSRALEVLGENPSDLPFALLYGIEPREREARLLGAVGIEAGHPAAMERLALDADAGWPLGRVAMSGAEEVVTRLQERFGPLPGGPWPESPQTAVVLPITRPGLEWPYGVLVSGVSPRRSLDEPYREFLTMVASHIATAVSNARAHEEERRRAEALVELDRAKTAFFSNVSHEFRTPLTLMLGPLEDLLAGSGGPLSELHRQELKVLQRNALRLLKLVNTLLDFSRMEAGRAQASFLPADLAQLTADLASAFHSAVERAGLRFEVDCPALPEPVYVDRDMWEKIVLNLLSNALKFTFEGEISVSLAWRETHVELRVRDTGVGIPREELPNLFRRFHRVQGAQSRTHEGSGIGLALVQELVRLHGGAIHVDSAPGRGSVFTVTVPTGRSHLPQDRIGAAVTLASTALGASPFVDEALRWLPGDRPHAEEGEGSEVLAKRDGARILVADDNADLRDYLRRILSPRWEVTVVADGIAALQEALAQPPDLLLADVMMPGLDGFELLNAVRAHPELQNLPVILVSARAGEEARVEGLSAGAQDYLVKPFSARELIARVASQLALAGVRERTDEMRRQMYDLFLQAPAPICVFRGPELVFELANPLYQQLAGNRPLVGRTVVEAIPEAVEQGFVALLQGVLETGEPAIFRESLLRFDRLGTGAPEDTWWTFIYAPLRNPQGSIDRVMALCVEVSDQVRARRDVEEAWRRAEELSDRLRLAVEVSQLGTWDFDPSTRDVQLSDRARSMLGLAGTGGRVLLESASDGVHPEDRDRVRDALEQALAGSDGGRIELEYRVASDGQGDRWLRWMAQTVFDGQGRPVRALGTVADITEAKRAELEAGLRETIANNATLALFLMDARQHCTYMNPAAETMTGFTLADVQGRPLHELVHHTRPDGRPYPLEECPIERALPTRTQERGEEVFVHRDGSFYPVAFTASPIVQNGLPIGTVIEVRDLTEEKRARRELQEKDERLRETLEREQAARREAEAASRSKDEFLAMLGHELRNPLSPILTALELMRLRAGSLLEHERTVVERQVRHLVGLVDDLLDVSRITRGKIELKRRRLELSAVVAKAVEMASPLFEQRRHTLRVEVPPAGLPVDADEVRLAQVVANLLMNAAKYTEPGGVVAVKAEPRGDEVELAVEDSGVGIPPHLLPHVFDLFVQGERSIDRSQGGLGLGLAIVKSLTELHGGRVEAHSEGPGRGSRFVVRLPLATELPAPFEAAGEVGAPSGVVRRRILIVDDNRDAAEMLAELLSLAGHETWIAEDGPSALALAAKIEPEVALLDIGLPVMDGHELAMRLRQQSQRPLLLIAVTGYGQREDRERARAAGFDDHLVKPIDLEALRARIERGPGAGPQAPEG
ncbi:MAG TPA: ATP-binding protein [Thermoanaerobaculia bacterium]|nr:ATP-binding protein [Thermoanaerobaculia bacterium]